ncbi:MAG: DUF3037 domain-containing protein [Chloroflexota bacterium]|nr:DUF3037 domain-containing protein [Chloroflexota bacterium]
MGRAPGDAATAWYTYAIIRVVPRVDRGECVNVGVVLFARERRFLGARIELDAERLHALAPEADVELIRRHLETFLAICAGDEAGGPLAALPPADRFHWLTAPRSTIIQTSAVHVGTSADPAAALDELLDAYVRPPRTSGTAPG